MPTCSQDAPRLMSVCRGLTEALTGKRERVFAQAHGHEPEVEKLVVRKDMFGRRVLLALDVFAIARPMLSTRTLTREVIKDTPNNGFRETLVGVLC